MEVASNLFEDALQFVSGFKFQVSGFKFQASGFRFQWLALKLSTLII